MNNYQPLSPYQNQQKPVEYNVNVVQPQPTPSPTPSPPIQPKTYIHPIKPKPKRRKLRIFLLILLGVFIGVVLISTIFYFSPIPERIYNSGTLYTQQTGLIKFTDGGVIKEVSLEAYCQNLNGEIK